MYYTGTKQYYMFRVGIIFKSPVQNLITGKHRILIRFFGPQF